MFQPESVAGVVFSPDRKSVLLIQRRDVPIWVLPGGGIEKGESAEQAIEREILEETGYEVRAVRWVGRYHPINRLAKKTALIECEVVGGASRLSSETRGVRFAALDALPPFPPPYQEWIEEGFSNLPTIERSLNSVNYVTLFQYAMTHPVFVLRFLLARLGLPWNN